MSQRPRRFGAVAEGASLGIKRPEALGIGHLINLYVLPAPKHPLAYTRKIGYLYIEIFPAHEVD